MWFLFAFAGAFFKSFSSFFRKKISKNVSASVFMWISYSLFLIALAPFVIIAHTPIYALLSEHLLVMIGATVPLLLATYFNLEALKREDLSYIAPLNAFVPLFTLIIAWLFLNEAPPLIGIVGICIIIVGAYIMNLSAQKSVHWYTPLVHIFKNTGARFSLAVALSYAINSVFMKSASNAGYSSIAIIFGISVISWLILAYVPFRSHRQVMKALQPVNFGGVISASVSSLFGSLANILAIAGTYTSYALSVRRFDMVISVLLGWKFLREGNIRYRLAGSALMTVGVIVLVIFK
ncbi:MAG: DMT family transporter [Candidatus Saccharimonadales bacterium]